MLYRNSNVDEHGLDEMDNKILFSIIEKFGGGQLGITTIATSVGEEQELLKRYMNHFNSRRLFKTNTEGREATAKAYTHIGKIPPAQTGFVYI